MAREDFPILYTLLEFMERNEIRSIPTFISRYLSDFLIPLIATVFVLGFCGSAGHRLWRRVVPAADGVRHMQAKRSYRQGQVSEAMKEWSKLSRYGPAYVSRMVHELYVNWDADRTLELVDKVQRDKVRVQIKQVEQIRMDAEALKAGGSGNQSMMDWNARLAKQEHLGINTK